MGLGITVCTWRAVAAVCTGGMAMRRVDHRVLRQLAEALVPGANLIARYRRDQRSLQATLEKRLLVVFDDLGNHVSGAARAYREPPVGEPDHWPAYVETVLTAAQLGNWATRRLVPVLREHWAVVTRMTQEAQKVHFRMGEARKPRLAPRPVPALVPLTLDQINRIADEGARRALMIDIAGDTRTAMFEALEQGRLQGWNPVKTARTFRDYIPQGRFTKAGSKYRAKMIARTETLQAQRSSALELYRASPDVKRVVAFDGEEDEECASRNGSEFTFDEAEAEATNTHPNCVLAFAPVT